MQWKQPKNTDKYHWTAHVVEKMHFYGLSEQKVLGVIKKPQRIETSVVENVVAVMVPVGNVKKNSKPSKWNRSFASDEQQEAWSQEIWVMYQTKTQSANRKSQNESDNPKIRQLQNKISSSKQITIISAWRYPGVSPKKNPIPEDILREIEEIGLV